MKCIVCGKESEFKICGECLIEREKIVDIDKFILEICSKCNSIKIGREWLKIELEKALEKAILDNLRHSHDFEVRGIRIQDRFAILRGILNGDLVEISVPIRYSIHRISCPRCSRESGGYYESIIQIRAVKRPLRKEEIERAKEIVEKAIRESEGEKDFISKFEFNKNGIDVYFGSRKLGEKVSRRIADELGGRIFESKKLHKKIDGRDSYRFTFLVRLPEYEEMDIVVKKDTLYVVKNARTGKGIDLLSGKYANVLNTEVAVKKSSFGWGIITNLDETSAEVMTEKGEILIVERPFGAEIGKEVYVFEYKNKKYAFPTDL
ncbi:MAG: ribosomal export protein [Archaeoglobaceae archaeon]|nr:ribosomal export protein [Archaeoglobaceae archaeon]MDK2877189.1 ribosomal export protein [Archaeoglobaceae archaeon]